MRNEFSHTGPRWLHGIHTGYGIHIPQHTCDQLVIVHTVRFTEPFTIGTEGYCIHKKTLCRGPTQHVVQIAAYKDLDMATLLLR